MSGMVEQTYRGVGNRSDVGVRLLRRDGTAMSTGENVLRRDIV